MQGPIVVVTSTERPSFAGALDEAKLFPVIVTPWADASLAVAQMAPAAVMVTAEAAEPELQALAKQIAAITPYVPLIAVDATTSLPDNAIPCAQIGGNSDRLIARLRSALRVRTLAFHRVAPDRRRPVACAQHSTRPIRQRMPPCF